MIFADRDPERDTSLLAWRVRLFGVGAIIGLVGIWADARWLVWIAVAVLVGGFVLRFVPGGEEGGSEGDPEEGRRAG